MRRKRDNLTLFLPFEEIVVDRTSDRFLLFQLRLAHYLAGRKPPTRLPMLKLLPSLNNSSIGSATGYFSEVEAAELLTQLGAVLEVNPHYLGRSKYRVTIPSKVAEELINLKKES